MKQSLTHKVDVTGKFFQDFPSYDKRGKGSYEENTGDAKNKQQDGA
jgi:hypothetical protein